MSRTRGIFNLSAANFEPLIAAPLDARSIVSFKDRLTRPETWVVKETDYTYKGMIVSVVSDTKKNNGLYMLIEDDYTDIRNWEKISSGGKVNYFEVFDKILVTKKLSAFEYGEKVLFQNESYVKGDNAFEDLSSALSLNLEGKTVILDDDTYQLDEVRIRNKNVTIKALTKAIIIGKVVISYPDGCTLENLTIAKDTAKNAELEPSEFLIECLTEGSGLTFRNVKCEVLSGYGSCLNIQKKINNLLIEKCTFKACSFENTKMTVPSMILNGVEESKFVASHFIGQIEFGFVSKDIYFEGNTIEFDNSAAFYIKDNIEGNVAGDAPTILNFRRNDIIGGEFYTTVFKLENINLLNSLIIKNNDISYTTALVELISCEFNVYNILLDFNTIKNQKTSAYVIKDGAVQRVRLSDGNSLSNIRYINCGGAI